jgi:hypothetical protein
VDEGDAVDAIFLDFAKAFDKVPRKRLFKKLSAHGVGGNLPRWTANWLDKRKQRVVLNGQDIRMAKCVVRCATGIFAGQGSLPGIHKQLGCAGGSSDYS